LGEHPPATEQVINRPVYGRVGIFMLNKAHRSYEDGALFAYYTRRSKQ
jgi:hypothetical protein